MKCYVGLGSNLGDRKLHLELALKHLKALAAASSVRPSPVYTTPALVPEHAPLDWRLPYLNLVVELEWADSPQELHSNLKAIELGLGRVPGPRWAPRAIDLDLLVFGQETISTENLRVPHPEIQNRSFVLDPLKDLAPNLRIPGLNRSVLELARSLPTKTPLIMGVLNVTPDSFSDGGALTSGGTFESRLSAMAVAGVQVVDIGAESTRPGAITISPDEEWARLRRPLEIASDLFRGHTLRPRLSIDTRNPETAQRALEHGADWINDVSGLDNPKMVRVLKDSSCEIVVMHHLGIPANPEVALQTQDPVEEVQTWLLQKLERLNQSGIEPGRLIFDPGIGFGKSAFQSIALLKGAGRLSQLPVRLLVGHSRKSFMKVWAPLQPQARDAYTLGTSLALASQGVDILRVHTPEDHLQALHGRLELFP